MSNPIAVKYWMPVQAALHRVGAWELIAQSYSEPHRAYHGWGHIGDLLKKLQRFSTLATRPDLIAAAVFWHDLVYRTRNADGSHRPDADNVRESAGAFARFSLFPANEAAAVEAMIMATVSHMASGASTEFYVGFSDDRDLFLDLDLSGLGGTWLKMSRDTHNIRTEFAWVPEAEFCAGRAAILRQFAADGVRLYRRDETNRVWGVRARENLLRSIADLESRAAAARASGG